MDGFLVIHLQNSFRYSRGNVYACLTVYRLAVYKIDVIYLVLSICFSHCLQERQVHRISKLAAAVFMSTTDAV